MATQKKIGGRGGVSQWCKLETVGDTRRLIAWAIRSFQAGTLVRADALAFGQLGAVLLKALEVSDPEREKPSLAEYLAVKQNGQPPVPPQPEQLQ